MTISRVENACKPLILLGLPKNIKIISTHLLLSIKYAYLLFDGSRDTLIERKTIRLTGTESGGFYCEKLYPSCALFQWFVCHCGRHQSGDHIRSGRIASFGVHRSAQPDPRYPSGDCDRCGLDRLRPDRNLSALKAVSNQAFATDPVKQHLWLF